MALQLETARIEPDITIVRVSGNITFKETDAINSLVRLLLDQGEKRLILELSGIAEIDRAGGVSLVRCFFAGREAGAEVCVARASPGVRQLFKSTQVEVLVPFFPTIAAAREHLTGSSTAEAGTA